MNLIYVEFKQPDQVRWRRAPRNPATGRFGRGMRLASFLAQLEKEGYETRLICAHCNAEMH